MGLFPNFKRSWGPTDDRWFRNVVGPTTAGVPVDEEESLKYTTLMACVGLISGDIAKMPLILFRRKKDGSKERVTDHPLYELLHNKPNEELNSFQWREASQGHLLLWGNTFHDIDRNERNHIVGLHPIYPGIVTVDRNRSGEIIYKWRDENNNEVVRLKKDIFHIPGFGFSGLVGKSMIQIAREAIGLGLSQEQYAARFIGSGTHPAGVLEMDGSLGEKGRKQFKESFQKQYAGLGKSHNVMVLEYGLKYKGLSMNMQDAQFLESRKFQMSEIAGFYRVPPHKVGIHGSNSNYNNLEQENQSYIDSNLSHWVSRWEHALNMQILTEQQRSSGLYFKFLMHALLRGDMTARGEYQQKLWQMGLPFNRILEMEDMNPVPGGDVGFIPLNMIPADMAVEAAEKQIEQPTQPPPEQQPDEEQKAVRVGWKGENRGIMIRDRISRAYFPLIEQAAQTIVNKEAIAIRKKIGQREDFTQWLGGFYDSMPEYIRSKLGPVLTSFATTIIDASYDEIGGDVKDHQRFINNYIDTYTVRHVQSSVGQLTSIDGDEEKEPTDLIVRVDEWTEKRPGKIARNETVKLSSAMFQVVAFGAGLSTVWRIRGKETCPYCQEFNGRRIFTGQSFVGDGDNVKPKGQEPMKIRGTKAHPPLHQGCDCYLGV